MVMQKQKILLQTLFNEMVLFAILLVLLVVMVVGAIVVRLVRESRRWRKFRLLLREWMEERDRRESS